MTKYTPQTHILKGILISSAILGGIALNTINVAADTTPTDTTENDSAISQNVATSATDVNSNTATLAVASSTKDSTTANAANDVATTDPTTSADQQTTESTTVANSANNSADPNNQNDSQTATATDTSNLNNSQTAANKVSPSDTTVSSNDTDSQTPTTKTTTSQATVASDSATTTKSSVVYKSKVDATSTTADSTTTPATTDSDASTDSTIPSAKGIESTDTASTANLTNVVKATDDLEISKNQSLSYTYAQHLPLTQVSGAGAWKGDSFAASIPTSAKGIDVAHQAYYIDEWMPDYAFQYTLWESSFKDKYATIADFRNNFTKADMATMTDLVTNDADQNSAPNNASATAAPTTYYNAILASRSMEGIQYATNLENVRIVANSAVSENRYGSNINGNLWDISKLKNDDKLQSVTVSGFAINDISALGNKPDLTSVDLVSNQISDISPLATDPKLVTTGIFMQHLLLSPITLDSTTKTYTTPSFIIKSLGSVNLPVSAYDGNNPESDFVAGSYPSTADGGNLDTTTLQWSNFIKDDSDYYGTLAVIWDDPNSLFSGLAIVPYTIADNVRTVNVAYQAVNADGSVTNLGPASVLSGHTGDSFNAATEGNSPYITNMMANQGYSFLGFLGGTGSYADYLAGNGKATFINQTGTFTAVPQNVTLLYAVPEGAYVNTNYVVQNADGSLTPITDANGDKMIANYVGTSGKTFDLTSQSKTIPGYNFLTYAYMSSTGIKPLTPASAAAIMLPAGPLTTFVVYQAVKQTIAIKYVDVNGTEIQPASSVTTTSTTPLELNATDAPDAIEGQPLVGVDFTTDNQASNKMARSASTTVTTQYKIGSTSDPDKNVLTYDDLLAPQKASVTRPSQITLVYAVKQSIPLNYIDVNGKQVSPATTVTTSSATPVQLTKTDVPTTINDQSLVEADVTQNNDDGTPVTTKYKIGSTSDPAKGVITYADLLAAQAASLSRPSQVTFVYAVKQSIPLNYVDVNGKQVSPATTVTTSSAAPVQLTETDVPATINDQPLVEADVVQNNDDGTPVTTKYKIGSTSDPANGVITYADLLAAQKASLSRPSQVTFVYAVKQSIPLNYVDVNGNKLAQQRPFTTSSAAPVQLTETDVPATINDQPLVEADVVQNNDAGTPVTAKYKIGSTSDPANGVITYADLLAAQAASLSRPSQVTFVYAVKQSIPLNYVDVNGKQVSPAMTVTTSSASPVQLIEADAPATINGQPLVEADVVQNNDDGTPVTTKYKIGSTSDPAKGVITYADLLAAQKASLSRPSQVTFVYAVKQSIPLNYVDVNGKQVTPATTVTTSSASPVQLTETNVPATINDQPLVEVDSIQNDAKGTPVTTKYKIGSTSDPANGVITYADLLAAQDASLSRPSQVTFVYAVKQTIPLNYVDVNGKQVSPATTVTTSSASPVQLTETDVPAKINGQPLVEVDSIQNDTNGTPVTTKYKIGSTSDPANGVITYADLLAAQAASLSRPSQVTFVYAVKQSIPLNYVDVNGKQVSPATTVTTSSASPVQLSETDAPATINDQPLVEVDSIQNDANGTPVTTKYKIGSTSDPANGVITYADLLAAQDASLSRPSQITFVYAVKQSIPLNYVDVNGKQVSPATTVTTSSASPVQLNATDVPATIDGQLLIEADVTQNNDAGTPVTTKYKIGSTSDPAKGVITYADLLAVQKDSLSRPSQVTFVYAVKQSIPLNYVDINGKQVSPATTVTTSSVSPVQLNATDVPATIDGQPLVEADVTQNNDAGIPVTTKYKIGSTSNPANGVVTYADLLAAQAASVTRPSQITLIYKDKVAKNSGSNPTNLVTPISPADPVAPIDPTTPVEPVTPVAPATPIVPVKPISPTIKPVKEMLHLAITPAIKVNRHTDPANPKFKEIAVKPQGAPITSADSHASKGNSHISPAPSTFKSSTIPTKHNVTKLPQTGDSKENGPRLAGLILALTSILLGVFGIRRKTDK